MEHGYVHSSSPQRPFQSPPPIVKQPQRRQWNRTSSVPSSNLPSSAPPRLGLGPSRPNSQHSLYSSSSASSSKAIDQSTTPPRSKFAQYRLENRMKEGTEGRDGGKAPSGAANDGCGRKIGVSRSRHFVDSESDDMPTPQGMRAVGVPVTTHRGAAFNKVRAVLNGDSHKADTQPKRKRRNRTESPDPILLSGRSSSPPPSSLVHRPLQQRSGGNPPPRNKKPDSKNRSKGPSKPMSTSTKLSADRTSSVFSISSTASKYDTDLDGEATPKPKASKALPRMRKTFEANYTDSQFKEEAEQDKANMFFMNLKKDGNDATRIVKPEKLEAILGEARKRDKEQQAEEQRQQVKREEEQRKRTEQTASSAAFFANMSQFRRDHQTTPTKSNRLMKLQLSSPEASFESIKLTVDEEYLLRFSDPSNLCPYCSTPMPKNPSADLEAMRKKLSARESKSVSERWVFCGFHKAETTAIPLGLRDNYRDDIDFVDLHHRLETGFIRLRLRHVVGKPGDSTLFRRTQRDIQAKGISGWQEANVQAEAARLATPGYYGDIGKQVIIHHFQQLIQWGFLPALSSDEIYPLSQTDFILNVLVPEAATLLIMQDKGWNKPRARGEGWQDALKTARTMRLKSAEYGRWRYREEGEEGQRVLKEITSEQHADKKHDMLEGKRDRDACRVKRTKPESTPMPNRFAEDPIDIGSSSDTGMGSDTGTADVSEWGDDEVDWGQATAALDRHLERPAPVQLSSREPFNRKESQSSTYGSWDDGFADEVVQQLNQNGWS